MDDEKGRWDFYGLCLKVGLVLGVGGGLFILAKGGDVVALVVLSMLGTVTLAGLGLGAALLVFDRTAQAEQRRFVQNSKENLLFLEQQARLQGVLLANQGRSAQTLQRQNEQLVKRLPGPSSPALGLDLDSLDWDLLPDLAEDQGGRQR